MIEVDKPVAVNPSRVRVSLGYTANMGDYESARVDISIEASARPGESSADAVERVYELVETKIVEKVNELKSENENTEA